MLDLSSLLRKSAVIEPRLVFTKGQRRFELQSALNGIEAITQQDPFMT